MLLYGPKRTILDDQQDLNNFTRSPGEDIKTAICRARCLNDRLRPLFSGDAWLEQTTRTLKQVLKNIILPQTRAHLECEELKCLKVGANLDFESMLELVDTFEISHKMIPSTNIGLIITHNSNMELIQEQELQVNSAVHKPFQKRKPFIKRTSTYQPPQPPTQEKVNAIITQTPIDTYKIVDTEQVKPFHQVATNEHRQTYGNYKTGHIGSQPNSQAQTQQRYQAHQNASIGQNRYYRPYNRQNYIQRPQGQYGQQQGQYGQQQGQYGQQQGQYSQFRPQQQIVQRHGYQGNFQRPYGYQNRYQSYQNRAPYNSHTRGQNRNPMTGANNNTKRDDSKILITVNENPYYMCKCHSMHLVSTPCPSENVQENKEYYVIVDKSHTSIVSSLSHFNFFFFSDTAQDDKMITH